MKRWMIVLLVIFAVCAMGIGFAVDFLQYKTLSFDLKGEGYTVEIRNDPSDSVVTTLTKSGDVRLKPGKYYYVSVGSGISDKEAPLTVTDGKVVTVDPPYSDARLDELALQEGPAILSLLTSTYPQIPAHYTPEQLSLFKRGDWGAGYLVQVVDPRQAPDVYRYVVQKEGGKWKVVAPPQLTISKYIYPSIPEDILDSINSALN